MYPEKSVGGDAKLQVWMAGLWAAATTRPARRTWTQPLKPLQGKEIAKQQHCICARKIYLWRSVQMHTKHTSTFAQGHRHIKTHIQESGLYLEANHSQSDTPHIEKEHTVKASYAL